MRYASVCSGIEAASVAWRPLGWECAWVSEIDPHACSVLSARFPDTPNLGDLIGLSERLTDDERAVDLLVGGTPCQGFSVAGQRGGMDDPRSRLAWEFLAVARRARPRWLVWENVPGCMSTAGGRDFGAILGAMGDLGYGVAWRVLDAQHVRVDSHPRAVPQRRRRVFVVGYLGDWRPPVAVLLEPEGMRGNPPPRREAGKGAARPLASCPGGGSGYRLDSDTAETPPLTGNHAMGHDASHANAGGQVAVAVDARQDPCVYREHTGAHGSEFPPHAVAVLEQRGRRDGVNLEVRQDGTANALRGSSGGRAGTGIGAIHSGMTVRRLTPLECERLQGFSDGHTAVRHRGKPMADGPRYRMLGNSFAVNVARWIGERIAMFETVSPAGPACRPSTRRSRARPRRSGADPA